jgi:hypothetical protein
MALGNPRKAKLGRPFRPNDVVVVPELFCDEEDTSVYDALLKEIKAAGSDSIFVEWHGDSHVIANDRDQGGRWKERSPTFRKTVERIREYFGMDIKATRLNWYRNSSDWKPLHHDAAAIKPKFAKTQNCTIAASFGHEREIRFERAKAKGGGARLPRGVARATVDVPVGNGSAYAFGRQANVDWRHGVKAIAPKERSDEGRISLIAWGWVDQGEGPPQVD